jgi:hypothetical protein
VKYTTAEITVLNDCEYTRTSSNSNTRKTSVRLWNMNCIIAETTILSFNFSVIFKLICDC